MKRVSVKSGRDGSITVSTEGFAGEECLRATERLERSLGDVGPMTPTAEMQVAEAERERD